MTPELTPLVRACGLAAALLIAAPAVGGDSISGLFDIGATLRTSPPEVDATPEFHGGEPSRFAPPVDDIGSGIDLGVAAPALLSDAAPLEPTLLDPPQPEPAPWDTDSRPANTGSVAFQSDAGELGSVGVQTAFSERGARLGLSHRYTSDGWLKNWETRYDGDGFDSLFTAGGTISLLERPDRVVAARLLGGVAVGNDSLTEDRAHFTGDLFASRRVGKTPQWIKYGWFVDHEEDFGKTGPAVAVRLLTPKCRVVTLDVAYAFGYGDDEVSTTSVPGGVDAAPISVTNLVAGADDDLQIRLGTRLCNGVELGGTTQYVSFDGPAAADGWEGGGYVGLPLGRGALLRLDATAGEFGARGFASLSWTPGAIGQRATRPRRRVNRCNTTCCPDGFCFAPVNRSVQVRKRRVVLTPDEPTDDPPPTPAPQFNVTCSIAFIGGTGDAAPANGQLDPGDIVVYSYTIGNPAVAGAVPLVISAGTIQEPDGDIVTATTGVTVPVGGSTIFFSPPISGPDATVAAGVPAGVFSFTVNGQTFNGDCGLAAGQPVPQTTTPQVFTLPSP